MLFCRTKILIFPAIFLDISGKGMYNRERLLENKRRKKNETNQGGYF
jgi:hypothetical protein